jgi:hypothetical protein
VPEFARQLAWGFLMLLLGVGMLRAEPYGQLLGYLFGLPVICLLGGVADGVHAVTRRGPAWPWRLAGGILGLVVPPVAVVIAWLTPTPPPGPHSNAFLGVVTLLVALLATLIVWGLLNGALSLAAAARSGPAGVVLGAVQTLTALLAAVPFVDAARGHDSQNGAFDVTIGGQVIVLLVGGAAVIVLATWRRLRGTAPGTETDSV